MKNLLLSVFAFAGLSAFGGQIELPAHSGTGINSDKSTIQHSFPVSGSSLRAVGCDTLINLAASDTNEYYFPNDTAAAAIQQGAVPGFGYLDGNGSVEGPSGLYTIYGIAEKFETPSTIKDEYVTAAEVLFSYVNIHATHADSSILVTVYVYDTTGTGAPGYGPGHAVDSATATLGSIATHDEAVFIFSHQAVLSTRAFFIALKLPQTTGDTIAVAFNNGTSGAGHAWIDLGAGGLTEWVPVDSIVPAEVGSFIFPAVCGTSTAGISEITAGVTDFSVYPNPANSGVFNANLHLASASNVTITVTDMTGRKIYESIEANVSELTKAIDLGNAAPGIYIVNIRTNAGSVNQRLTISK